MIKTQCILTKIVIYEMTLLKLKVQISKYNLNIVLLIFIS